jgi:hypothetical protein
MAASTGPLLATGGVTIFRQVIIQKKPITTSIRVVVAVGFLAVGLAGLEKINTKLAVGLAYVALVTSLVAPIGGKAALTDIAEYLNTGVGK